MVQNNDFVNDFQEKILPLHLNPLIQMFERRKLEITRDPNKLEILFNSISSNTKEREVIF